MLSRRTFIRLSRWLQDATIYQDGYQEASTEKDCIEALRLSVLRDDPFLRQNSLKDLYNDDVTIDKLGYYLKMSSMSIFNVGSGFYDIDENNCPKAISLVFMRQIDMFHISRMITLEWITLGEIINVLHLSYVGRLSNLTHLELNGCNIEEFPDDISRLSLKHLSLRTNRLVEFPRNIIENLGSTLKVLIIGNNQIREIPDDITRLYVLNTLDLTNTVEGNIRNIPDLSSIRTLRTLLLYNSGLMDIPEFLWQYRSQLIRIEIGPYINHLEMIQCRKLKLGLEKDDELPSIEYEEDEYEYR